MSHTKIIEVKRKIYTAQTTVGEVSIPDESERFCYSLEDTVRAYGIKVKKHTAIPEGVYKVTITHSNRFKRDMIQLFTEDDLTLVNYGISFEGVRVHGGNTHESTEGCPLVAYNLINDHTIQGTAEKELTEIVRKWIAAGCEVYWRVSNGVD